MKRVAKVGLICHRPICLAGLNSIIGKSEDFTVVSVATGAGDLLAMIASDAPDIIVCEFDGRDEVLKGLGAVISQNPQVKLIAMSVAIEVDHAVYLLDVGAKGYISLGSSAEELIEALHQVADGDSYVSPSVATKVISAMRNAAMHRSTARSHNLTVREEQIGQLLCQGKTNREIAKGLGLREKTVKHYMSQLMQKMHVRNRLEVAMALQAATTASRPPLRLVN